MAPHRRERAGELIRSPEGGPESAAWHSGGVRRHSLRGVGDGYGPVFLQRARLRLLEPAVVIRAAQRHGRRRQRRSKLCRGGPGVTEENRWLTIGIEEEFQIVEEQGHLRSHIDTLLEQATPSLGEQIKPEMMQSVVEIGTTICENVEEARGEIMRLRSAIASFLRPAGLRIVSAGTHPFSHWQDQKVTQKERYMVLEEEMQDVIRDLLIFGMHVHIGIPDPDLRIEIMNEARYFLPHMLALSTSSPFWLTRNTGLKSYRHVIWSSFPRTGTPPDFESWDEFQHYVDLLVKTGTIDNGRKIWWDVRPHVVYPTLEFRVCDAATRVEETVILAGLFQAICAKLIKLRRQNLGFRKYLPSLINENKWRAIRHGL